MTEQSKAEQELKEKITEEGEKLIIAYQKRVESKITSEEFRRVISEFQNQILATFKEAGWFREAADLVGRLLDRGWIPPGEAKGYVKLADIKAIYKDAGDLRTLERQLKEYLEQAGGK